MPLFSNKIVSDRVWVRRFLLSAICFCILSCTAVPEVQLYTQYLSEEEVESVKRLLQQQNFKVVPNQVKVPDGLLQTSLIYSPLNRNIDQVNRLIDILSNSPFGVPQLELTGKENHYYGTNTVGLYIVTDEHRKEKTLNSIYALEYNGRCRSDDANLLLKEDGSATLLTYQWVDTNDNEVTIQCDGHWCYRDHLIYVAIDNNQASEFAVLRREQSGERGYKEIRLNNNGVVPFYDNCNFVYRALTH